MKKTKGAFVSALEKKKIVLEKSRYFFLEILKQI